jgi:hypothetical protein
MDSLLDILSRKNFDEPPEVTAIKRYVQTTFQENVSVKVRDADIIITASSASLANTLRLQTLKISRLINTNKRLIFRTGK